MSQMTLKTSAPAWSINASSSNVNIHNIEYATNFQIAITNRSRHVLVLDEGWAQTIDLAVGLENAGHRVTVLTANGGTSRCRYRTVQWRSGPALASRAFLPHLDQLMSESCFDHVLPITEAAMTRLWDASPTWAGQIYPATAEWQRRLLRDKYALSEHLAARGVDVPWQRRLSPHTDPSALARELGLPLVVKGATGAGGSRVAVVQTVQELARAMQRMRSMGGGWGVQEFVDGPTVLFGGLFHDGRPLRIFAGEKLEQHPRRTGPAIRLRSVADPAILDLGTRILRALRWTGFASVDFIRRSDGRYTFLEVNPRLWGSAAAARSAGVDLFTPLAAALAGEPPAPDLTFAADQDIRIFPRYLLSRAYWRPSGVLRAVRDLLGAQGRPWRDPGLLRHLASRLYRLHRSRDAL
jgi:hypothetical protein